MKDKEHSLLYHTMHSRPMPGCLPLFFLLALVVVGTGIWFAPVKVPERVRPEGVGHVYVKDDKLTNFMVRRHSPLPLQLPLHVDPEFREDVDAAAMPLVHPARIRPLPPQPLFDTAADSAVLDAAALLALPGDEPTAPAAVAPAPDPSPVPASEPAMEPAEPVFHPGVDKAAADEDSEEVAL